MFRFAVLLFAAVAALAPAPVQAGFGHHRGAAAVVAPQQAFFVAPQRIRVRPVRQKVIVAPVVAAPVYAAPLYLAPQPIVLTGSYTGSYGFSGPLVGQQSAPNCAYSQQQSVPSCSGGLQFYAPQQLRQNFSGGGCSSFFQAR